MSISITSLYPLGIIWNPGFEDQKVAPDTDIPWGRGAVAKLSLGKNHCYTIWSEEAAVNYEAAEYYIEKFANIVSDKNLIPRKFILPEKAQYWDQILKKTFIVPNKRVSKATKNSSQKITVLVCVNASGSPKTRWAVIGKTKIQDVKSCNYFTCALWSNKKIWVTRYIFSNWLDHHFASVTRSWQPSWTVRSV